MIMTGEETKQVTKVTDVSADLLANWLDAGDTVLVDVREDFEHAEERIEGAINHPLSAFDAQRLCHECGDKRIVFHCQSGKRSREAVNQFRDSGRPLFHLADGIESWKASGRPVMHPHTRRLPIMRQVQVAAGALVALSVGLGTTVSPWFLAIAGFVGCGLMFAGITGWCGMARLLAVMPWNRIPY
ncbi:MAG: rhodanese-like domain-containing protein [Planctomycetota bacterium]|jgi:rhodanese-related sulfurtransferase